MKTKFPHLYLLPALLLAAFTFNACGDDDDIDFGKGESTGGVTVSNEITSRMETPETLTDGSTVLLSHSTTSGSREILTYSLEYDKSKYHSRWVAFRFDGDTRARNVSRADEPFQDDPDLPTSLRIGSGGFNSGSGTPGVYYNRGHLCASADRLYSAEANNQTFYMSNMSPQYGNFNSGYWVTLEGLVQRLGRDASFSDTLYVVKGGAINDGNIINYVSRSNGTQVAVPRYYYMALLKIKNGIYSSIAFWLEHKNYTEYDYQHTAPLTEIATHVVTVNQLEELTGINFFPNLPDNSGAGSSQTEESIENQLIPGNWGM